MIKRLLIVAIFLSTTSLVSMNREELMRQLMVDGDKINNISWKCSALILSIGAGKHQLSNAICSLISAENCIPNTEYSLWLLSLGIMGYGLYKTVPTFFRFTGTCIRLLREWPRDNDDDRETGNQYEHNS